MDSRKLNANEDIEKVFKEIRKFESQYTPNYINHIKPTEQKISPLTQMELFGAPNNEGYAHIDEKVCMIDSLITLLKLIQVLLFQ